MKKEEPARCETCDKPIKWYEQRCARCADVLDDAPEPDDWPCPGCGRMLPYWQNWCPDCDKDPDGEADLSILPELK